MRERERGRESGREGGREREGEGGREREIWWGVGRGRGEEHTHIEVSEPLRIFSNQIPANPERKHADMTAARPTTGLPAAAAALPAPAASDGAWQGAGPVRWRLEVCFYFRG